MNILNISAIMASCCFALVYGQHAPSLEQLDAYYQTKLNEVYTKSIGNQRQLDLACKAAIKNASDALRSDGDLSAVLEARELTQAIESGAKDLPEIKNEKLLAICQTYREKRAEIDLQTAKSLVSVTDVYTDYLHKQVKTLTSAGEVETAIAFRDHAEKILASEEYKEDKQRITALGGPIKVQKTESGETSRESSVDVALYGDELELIHTKAGSPDPYRLYAVAAAPKLGGRVRSFGSVIRPMDANSPILFRSALFRRSESDKHTLFLRCGINVRPKVNPGNLLVVVDWIHNGRRDPHKFYLPELKPGGTYVLDLFQIDAGHAERVSSLKNKISGVSISIYGAGGELIYQEASHRGLRDVVRKTFDDGEKDRHQEHLAGQDPAMMEKGLEAD